MKIKSEMLKEGTRYSAPVFFDDGENMFLAANKKIKKHHLDIIKRWEVPFLLTEGYELAESEEKTVEKTYGETELETLKKVDNTDEKTPYPIPYMVAIKTVEAVFASWRNEQKIEKSSIDEAIEKLYQFIEEDKFVGLRLVIGERPTADSYAVAAVNIAILSTVMAMELMYSKKEIQSLIAAAFLHDVAMQDVPEQILDKKGALTAEEFEQLKMHTHKSSMYAENVLLYSREISLIIEQHHERWDGKGYPEGKKETEINKYARILSVAEAFDAMISKKTYRNSVSAYEAVKNLLRDKQKRFDSAVLKVFIKCIGVYPVGSYVLLNDSSVAVVVQSVTNAPFMPKIKIIIPSDSAKAKNTHAVRLEEQTSLFIVRDLTAEEVSLAKKQR
ncbi:MAG TPA: HD domain-containing phosphohydrolase [Treponemataceae bacterium]|nr:HD domain-containing phosphohydrolase [Treponemataceae bacterium]